MKTPQILTFGIFAISVLTHAESEDIRRAEISGLFPLPGATDFIIPDFAEKGAGLEDIKKPGSLTDEEKDVLQTATQLSTDELADLAQVYERMGNTAMQQLLARALLQRVPDHPVALHLLKTLEGAPEVRKPDYLDRMSREVLAGKLSTDPEAVSSEARSLLGTKQPEPAIALLEALRNTTYPGKAFPYSEDLAYAYMEAGKWDQAEDAFSDALARPTDDGTPTQRLRASLDLVRVEKQVAKLRKDTYAEPDAALRASEKLLAELPRHPSAIAFRVECLQYAGRSSEALSLLNDLKRSTSNSPAFAYQRLLGYTCQQLKLWDDAQDAFQELSTNPTFSQEARMDGATALQSTQIAKAGDAALTAVTFGEWEKAEELISQLEKSHPQSLEVISYRCSLLARTGRSIEALKLLTDKRRQLASTGKPFPLQDTVADVHTARKDFDLARTACQEILDNTKYDWSMRRRAMDAQKGIRKAELMEQAFLALRDRRLGKAKEAAETMKSEFGAEVRELRLIEADIKLAQNKVGTAADELEALESTTPVGQPFEAKSSLATSYLRTGRIEKAMEAYRNIVDHSRAFTPYEAAQARSQLRTTAPLAKPNVEALASHRSEQDGSITRLDSTYSGPWWDQWRAKITAHADLAKVDPRGTAGSTVPSNERYESIARVQRKLGSEYAAEVSAGASQDDVIYGARFGKLLTPGLNWSAAYSGNIRSTDSIPLEALDARENRAELAFGGPLPGPWNVDLRTYANWVRVRDTEIGHALGSDLELDYILRAETERHGQWSVGYLAQYRKFTAADAASAYSALVDPETNRHGVTLGYNRTMGASWQLGAQVGGFYAIDESAAQYMGSANAQYFFNDDLSAFLNVRYDSNSRSAGTDIGAMEALFGLQKIF